MRLDSWRSVPRCAGPSRGQLTSHGAVRQSTLIWFSSDFVRTLDGINLSLRTAAPARCRFPRPAMFVACDRARAVPPFGHDVRLALMLFAFTPIVRDLGADQQLSPTASADVSMEVWSDQQTGCPRFTQSWMSSRWAWNLSPLGGKTNRIYRCGSSAYGWDTTDFQPNLLETRTPRNRRTGHFPNSFRNTVGNKFWK